MDRPLSSRGREIISNVSPRTLLTGALEVLIAVAVATGAVAALQSTAPAVGLATLYLLAVLEVAIRRGELPALATALLSALALNYFFIAPRHQLAIAHSQDVVVLVVLLIAALVVGRLAALARRRAGEAEHRAQLATAREREATLVAEAASAIVAGRSVTAQLDSIGRLVARATGATSARLVLGQVSSPALAEVVVPVRSTERSAWLYVSNDLVWDRRDLERISEPLGRLIDVALERERVAERAAETEAARLAEVAKTAVLHAISHDLRSPLTAITTAASALRDPALTASDRSELHDVIEAEASRLARLVDDLLDLSRIEAGAIAPQADWCDLHDVVASAAAHVRTAHPVEFALPRELPLVRADAAQLERVFSNLIENAVKFSPPGSPVHLSAAVADKQVTVCVTDRGPGIPAFDRERVFEPFFRSRGTSGAGSGLGLAICRGFVDANGGRIVVQSDTGLGTSFEVSLPVASQPASSSDALSEQGSQVTV